MSSLTRDGRKRTWRRSQRALLKTDLRRLYKLELLTQAEWQAAISLLADLARVLGPGRIGPPDARRVRAAISPAIKRGE